ncbi:MAG TPA: HAD hydrolase-like protein [Bryobacteraceae bacterium]|nr:HAD hydrolase-like protein [Bryobacteraceae bacterium]
MQRIDGLLFEPVGCLAEFPSEPFHEIAVRCFGMSRGKKPSRSASRSYWHLLNLMQAAGEKLDDSENALIEALELEAVDGTTAYEDVLPALSELKAMGIQLLIASSLSRAATTRFLEKCSIDEFFSAVWNRDNAGGIKAAPLARAIGGAALPAERTAFLTDTAEGLKVAEFVGVNSILMMNDPDEAKRLATRDPAGGIVSLHELPDFVRFVAAKNARS